MEYTIRKSMSKKHKAAIKRLKLAEKRRMQAWNKYILTCRREFKAAKALNALN